MPAAVPCWDAQAWPWQPASASSWSLGKTERGSAAPGKPSLRRGLSPATRLTWGPGGARPRRTQPLAGLGELRSPPSAPCPDQRAPAAAAARRAAGGEGAAGGARSAGRLLPGSAPCRLTGPGQAGGGGRRAGIPAGSREARGLPAGRARGGGGVLAAPRGGRAAVRGPLVAERRGGDEPGGVEPRVAALPRARGELARGAQAQAADDGAALLLEEAEVDRGERGHFVPQQVGAARRAAALRLPLPPPHPADRSRRLSARPLPVLPRRGRPQNKAETWLHSGLMRTDAGRYRRERGRGGHDGGPGDGGWGGGGEDGALTVTSPRAAPRPLQPYPPGFSDFSSSPRATSHPEAPVPRQKTQETLGRWWGTGSAGTGGQSLQACAPRKAQPCHHRVTKHL